jgi:hypothetical protein
VPAVPRCSILDAVLHAAPHVSFETPIASVHCRQAALLGARHNGTLAAGQAAPCCAYRNRGSNLTPSAACSAAASAPISYLLEPRAWPCTAGALLRMHVLQPSSTVAIATSAHAVATWAHAVGTTMMMQAAAAPRRGVDRRRICHIMQIAAAAAQPLPVQLYRGRCRPGHSILFRHYSSKAKTNVDAKQKYN